MNNEVKQVATFDDVEASAPKEPDQFQNFCYDNKSGVGVITAFENIVKQIGKIQDDIEAWNTCTMNSINLYQKFSNLEDSIKSIKDRMNNSCQSMSERAYEIMEDAKDFVDYQMKVDSSYIKDLEFLNNTLSKMNVQK